MRLRLWKATKFVTGWMKAAQFGSVSPAEGVTVFAEGYLPERDKDQPQKIYFDGTDTLEVRIVEKLAHLCGPFLLAGEMFILVDAGTPADTPWRFWPRRI